MIKDQIKETHIDYNDLAAAADRFPEIFANKSPLTVTAYLSAVKDFLFYFRSFGQFSFTDKDTEKYIKYLKESRLLKPNSIIMHLTALRKFFEYLKSSGFIEKNPARRIKLKRESDMKKVNFFTKSEIDKLIESIDNTNFTGLRDISVISVYVYCCISESELSSIKCNDVIKSGRFKYIVVNEIGNKVSKIKIPNEVYVLLKTYMSLPEVVNNEYLFLSVSNRTKALPLTVRGISNLLTQRLLNCFKGTCSIEKLKPYSLKNSGAIFMAASGKTPEEINSRLKLKNLSSIEKFYKLVDEFNS